MRRRLLFSVEKKIRISCRRGRVAGRMSRWFAADAGPLTSSRPQNASRLYLMTPPNRVDGYLFTGPLFPSFTFLNTNRHSLAAVSTAHLHQPRPSPPPSAPPRPGEAAATDGRTFSSFFPSKLVSLCMEKKHHLSGSSREQSNGEKPFGSMFPPLQQNLNANIIKSLFKSVSRLLQRPKCKQNEPLVTPTIITIVTIAKEWTCSYTTDKGRSTPTFCGRRNFFFSSPSAAS